jgi:hypothetical protein
MTIKLRSKVSGPRSEFGIRCGRKWPLTSQPLRGDVSLEEGIFPLNALIVPSMASEKQQSYPQKPQNEYGKFTDLLDKLLTVPHSKIKAELEIEKRQKPSEKKRAAVGRAYRDTD